ncbi:LysR family transcriptional regulator, partial [Pseudoalteromonas rubra]
MNKWTEMRTAYRLAKLGTLSATAQELGVHRSTVMRHIDVLESALGVTLFQRNDRGYLPTEAGLEIMR